MNFTIFPPYNLHKRNFWKLWKLRTRLRCRFDEQHRDGIPRL